MHCADHNAMYRVFTWARPCMCRAGSPQLLQPGLPCQSGQTDSQVPLNIAGSVLAQRQVPPSSSGSVPSLLLCIAWAFKGHDLPATLRPLAMQPLTQCAPRQVFTEQPAIVWRLQTSTCMTDKSSITCHHHPAQSLLSVCKRWTSRISSVSSHGHTSSLSQVHTCTGAYHRTA